jgi:hypothetical protein
MNDFDETPEVGEIAVIHQARQQPQGVTQAQAKVDAIAHLTMAAYSKAGMLQLTPEEAARLQAEFPDEAFRPGAAGKENLIYIEHTSLRSRLNEVFGPGQWSIVPRNRWTEEYKTSKGDPVVRVYVEAMLVARGCFVGEAVGDMSYYPKNESTNFGDAVEGAKTAALRRCAKELGIGLQAWSKTWCDGWWARRNGPRQGPVSTFTHPDPRHPDPVEAMASTAPRQPQGALPACPKCGTNKSTIRGKEEYGGGFVCFAKKNNGCGQKWK